MPDSFAYTPVITSNLSATIANAASLSNATDISGTSLVGYIMPAAWTSADITLQASVDGTNFYDLYDEFGNEITHNVDASRFIALAPSDLVSVRHIKFRSGTSAAATNQGAERVITLVTRAV